jgi:HEAT repeat protein
MSDDDSNDLPAVPDNVDTSDELAKANAQLAGLDDEQAAAKIGSRTSVVAILIGLAMVGSAGYLGVVTYQRDQASQHRWEAFHAAQEADSEAEFLRLIREDLPRTEFTDVRQEYINEFAEHHDAAAVPLLIPILQEAGPMRAHAARALAEIGSPAADAAKPDLLAVLPTCDIRDRAPVVWALAVLGESAASNEIIEEFAAGRLQHQHGFDPRVITNVLGVGRLSSPELMDHESVGVRTLVAQALSEAATADTIDPLSHMIQHEQELEESDTAEGAHAAHDSVIRACIGGLGRVGDPRAATPLFAQMQRNPGMRVAVLDALRRTTGARGLAVLLAAATDDATRTDLVEMLRATHDPNAADALASQLGSTDEHLRMLSASGLAEVSDVRAVPVLVQLAQSESLETGRDALDMLKLLHAPEIAPGLIPMLAEERFLGRRASIITALGATGSPEAGRELMEHLEGDDIGSAANALAALNYDPAFEHLLDMIPRPRDVDFSAYQGMAGVPHEMEYNNRTAAVRALGRFGRPEAAEALETIVEDAQDDIRLRNDAGLALGACANDEILETVIAKIQQTDLDEAARRFYLGALWQHPSRAVAGRLMELMTNPATPPDVRHPAAIAIGYASDPANDERLIALLENHDMAFDAGIAIILGGSDAAARALLAKLGEDDDLRQSLQTELMNAENDFFNLVTTDLWDSGEVYRRLRVAEILNDGDGDNRQGYAWQTFAARLQSGWSGVHGLTANDIRQRMLTDIGGTDAERRALIARALGAMNATGLLMAARDGGGAGAEDARRVLFEMNRPTQDDDAPVATE